FDADQPEAHAAGIGFLKQSQYFFGDAPRRSRISDFPLLHLRIPVAVPDFYGNAARQLVFFSKAERQLVAQGDEPAFQESKVDGILLKSLFAAHGFRLVKGDDRTLVYA